MKLKIFDLFLQIIIVILSFILFMKDGFIIDLFVSIIWVLNIILSIFDIQNEMTKKQMDKFIDNLKDKIDYKEENDDDH